MAKRKPLKHPADESILDGWMLFCILLIYVMVLVYVGIHVGDALAGVNQRVPGNPLAVLIEMARGKVVWPTAATVVVVIMIALTLGCWFAINKYRKRPSPGVLPVDSKADVMATGGALGPLTEPAVRKKAEELGVRLGPDDAPGVLIGISVADGVPLYGSYEDLHLDLWGPRQGKTTSRVIPAILDAIGPVIATSNKRDVVDATADIRSRKGPVYIFDPQSVVGADPTWFWNPLAWVRGPSDDLRGAEVRAAKLAGHFADSDDGLDAKADSFFDPEGEDLLAGLFLAAALTNAPISTVWEWVSNQQNDEPAQILRNMLGQDYPTATGLVAQYNAEQRTKSGIFGTAKKMARCLRFTNVLDWVRPNGGRELDELELIDRDGTLYCLSLEGRGSAGALVSALTEAVIDVAMRRAAQLHMGRLDVPLLAVLDEAANIVRWKDLPKQYSHFGSRGIIVMTVLQSWAQGARCWGVDGMNAMWAAANIRVIGSGVDDTGFLRERSEAIGDFDVISRSVSKSKGSRSVSSSMASARTFSVSDLISLPRGRVIVFPSGGKSALVRTLPWWEGSNADEVRRSIERHDPQRSGGGFRDIRDEELLLTDRTAEDYAKEVPSL